MDRKALAVIIIFLSSLVVLLLLNLNQPAMAPEMSPIPTTPETTLKPSPTIPLAAKLNTTDAAAPVNETVTPTPGPVIEIVYTPPQTQNSEPSPSAPASPSRGAAMQPWQAVPAWSPMPMASPLSW